MNAYGICVYRDAMCMHIPIYIRTYIGTYCPSNLTSIWDTGGGCIGTTIRSGEVMHLKRRKKQRTRIYLLWVCNKEKERRRHADIGTECFLLSRTWKDFLSITSDPAPAALHVCLSVLFTCPSWLKTAWMHIRTHVLVCTYTTGSNEKPRSTRQSDI